MTDFRHKLWCRVVDTSKAGFWYRAKSIAETRALRELHANGYLHYFSAKT